MPPTPIVIRAVIVAAFEPESGPIPGELRHFIDRQNLTERLPLPAAYRPLYFNPETGILGPVLGVVTGVGAARAAASITALGLDPRFDLTHALWLITGVAGIDPARGSLASVALPEYVVDGALTHELDAREIPPNDPAWPDGFVPIGKSLPCEQPLAHRFNGDDGIVFRLNPTLVAHAFSLLRDTPLLDTESMAARRQQFTPAAARQPPAILRGDELASTTFWHGALLSRRAARWVDYQTAGRATYAITAMEDAGILQSLTFLAAAGRVDLARVLILRAASNYDQQRPGVTAAESLIESRVAANSAYLPALENVHRAATRLLQEL